MSPHDGRNHLNRPLDLMAGQAKERGQDAAGSLRFDASFMTEQRHCTSELQLAQLAGRVADMLPGWKY
jgi:hypothetical protein